MFQKIVAMISAILLSVLSMTSFKSYALENEDFMIKKTVMVSPSSRLAFGSGLANVVSDVALDIVFQKILESLADHAINAGISSEIETANVIYGKANISGTSYNIADGLVELLVYTDDTFSGGDFSWIGVLKFTNCGQLDGAYKFSVSGSSRQINYNGGNTIRIVGNATGQVGGTFSPYFWLNSNYNTVRTTSFTNNYTPQPSDFLNSYYYSMSSLWSNDETLNINVQRYKQTTNNVLPFIHIQENLFKASNFVSEQLKFQWLNNKFEILQNSIVTPVTQTIYNVNNSFPEYDTLLSNPVTFNANNEYNFDYSTIVPIVPPPESSGGGGVPSDWLGSYPPLSTVENFHIDNESVVSYVENVDFQPLSDSFRLFGFVSDFLSEINVLPIFLSLLGLGLICWIIF